MKKNYKKILAFGIMTMMLFGSCKKFLDVQPEDKVLENQVLAVKRAFKRH